MEYPYSVESKIRAVDLYQLNDGRFQMIRQGNLSPFMQGVDYILVETKLAKFLETLDISHIEFVDAVVWDRGIDKEYKNYKQLIVRQYFTEENIAHLDLRRLQMYLFGLNYLFVSPELKELLENSEFDYLKFSEGFRNFVS